MINKKYLGLIFISCIILLLALNLFLRGGITGRVVSDMAQGGNITELDLSTNPYIYWEGYHGNLTRTGHYQINDTTAINITGTFQDVTFLDLNLIKCYNTELYASSSPVHLNITYDPTLPGTNYMNSLSPATGSELDTYYNFSSLPSGVKYLVSGNRTFSSNNYTFEVGDTNLSIPSVTLNSVNGIYPQGLLKDQFGNIILVFNLVENGIAFNGKKADFQVMLPVSPVQNLRYYFFQDYTDDCNFPAGIGPSLVVANVATPINLSEEIGLILYILTNKTINASFSIIKTNTRPVNFTDFGLIALNKYIDIRVSEIFNSLLTMAEIRIDYTDAEVSAAGIDESTLRPYTWNGTHWNILDNVTVDTINNFVSGFVNHFSIFSVFGSSVSAPTPGEAEGDAGEKAEEELEEELLPKEEEREKVIEEIIKLVKDLEVEIELIKSEIIPSQEDLTVEISLTNLEAPAEIKLYYLITDSEDNMVLAEEETISIQSKIKFIKIFKLPLDIKIGDYKLTILLINKEQKAIAISLFKINSDRTITEKATLFSKVVNRQNLLIITGIGLIALVIYILIKKSRKRIVRKKKK